MPSETYVMSLCDSLLWETGQLRETVSPWQMGGLHWDYCVGKMMHWRHQTNITSYFKHKRHITFFISSGDNSFSRTHGFCEFNGFLHDDISTWKCFSHYWPFAKGIHQLDQQCLMFSLLLAWTGCWTNTQIIFGELRCHDTAIYQTWNCYEMYI